MPFVCLPLEGEDSPFTVCGVGSPSTPGDEYIRSLMGNPGKDVATLLLGVCFRPVTLEKETAQWPTRHLPLHG